ncbi:hypothetical protein BZG35_05890 [Brevundimonas sp. LM2]|uniref:hypothetical protein n=1 Tax=Brevundimonas sp. LM2 TaxID=1938605 RepID=UPI0009838E94|nr:hypothetical protein [Brevundimonas sp. LM2]AQR63380.1 hypothetical protein BZG35_05890 [Brevundimonas sp. LM2]
MRRLVSITPFALAFGLAVSPASAQTPQVNVTVGGDLVEAAEGLGQRDVDLQVERLTTVVSRELARRGGLEGAQVNLVLTDLKPNRPTFEQVGNRPGLSVFDSISIGGATIEGEVVTVDGQRLPVRYSRYSTSLADVYGFGTWQDADRAYSRLASNLASGRLVSR